MTDHGTRAIVATAQHLPDLSPDCGLFPPALEALGWDVRIEAWDDPTVDWAAADVVIIRSIWDYFQKRVPFLAWLDQLDAVGATVLNPTRVIRHNLDKRYLGELGEAGASIVPTLYASAAEGVWDQARQHGWDEVVMKPTVNGAGRNTHRVTLDDRERFENALRQTLQDGEILVQLFLPEVLTDGEWSLIFFDGEYSHAVRKRAAHGEFRVQDDWGGTVHFDQPSDQLIAQCHKALTVAEDILGLQESLPYARVDGVVSIGEFMLMELELIEPELFLRAHPEAPARAARAIASRLDCRA